MTKEQKAYGADVREQKIVLPNIEEAEKLRQFLEQHEVDTVVFVPQQGWVYLRKRAMAVEQAVSHQVPPASGARKKRKRKGLASVPDPPAEPTP